MAVAKWNGVVIAESDQTVVVEGNHYFPRDAVWSKYLMRSDTTTHCPWKGDASYHSLVVNGETNEDAEASMQKFMEDKSVTDFVSMIEPGTMHMKRYEVK